ncbi:hypothetical protein IQ37_18715 [Chryseobacterium piperi]|uniref:Uncharacterized protein n=1 Tax=Chryseobacterium piperi TaxID=558152 RepID=A0A086AF42_9FLAO|nr:hypothetical protein [Chryseobacterium piperi]ASW73941.2 hypothetical protein CJF12_06315 [Chryseobacterium piperi]KFF15306.1 hypothetical protein IQ37_18715 [Chryseobacterium piperi]
MAIKDLNFNNEIDDIDVVMMELPNHPGKLYRKAFQVLPNIFVMPVSHFFIKTDTPETWIDQFTSNEQRDRFLKEIQHILYEINEGHGGHLLLEQLSNLKPIPHALDDNGAFDARKEEEKLRENYHDFNLDEGFFEIKKVDHAIKKVGHVLIMAPSPTMMERKNYSYESSVQETSGSCYPERSIVALDPKVTLEIEHSKVLAPIFMPLAHELCHSRQRLLNMEEGLNNEFVIPWKYANDEEPLGYEVKLSELRVANSEERSWINEHTDWSESVTGFEKKQELIDRIAYELTNFTIDTQRTKYNAVQDRLSYRSEVVFSYERVPIEDTIIADSLTALSDKEGHPIYTMEDIGRCIRKGYLDHTYKIYQVDNVINPNYKEAKLIGDAGPCS